MDYPKTLGPLGPLFAHRNVEEMWKVLSRGESPVAELVCNPQSFTQTVENVFTLAFLVSL